MKKFFHTVPKLPSTHKQYSTPDSYRDHRFTISSSQTREEIISYLSGIRHLASGIDLAFYAGRFMNSIDWKPFYKAAFERNPVSVLFFKEHSLEKVYETLLQWPEESIYSEMQLSLPDEVVNFKRGDGLEKMITLMNVVKARHLDISAEQHGIKLIIRTGDQKFIFETKKKITIPKTNISLEPQRRKDAEK
jgi:hypothetical protein